MKYIESKKLIAEIERRREKCADIAADEKNEEVAEYYRGKEVAYDETSSLINSLQQEQPDGYNRAMIEVKAKVDELYDETSIGLSEYDAGFYNGIIETCMKLRGFIKARISKEQPEVDLEKFTDKIKTFQERYKYPEVVSIKGAMAFMARMFYQYPNVARQWYDSLPKATMD